MTSQKAIIFDSSTLISLAMNALLPELRNLKNIFKGKFIITQEVKEEIINKPLNIKKFELEALKLSQLLNEKVLEMPDSLGINDSVISDETKKVMDIANSTFRDEKRDIHLIDSGEASCVALSKILTDKKIKNVIAVDERTMRMLCEKPENLLKLFQGKLHKKIFPKKENYKFFKGFEFIRSSELVYVAYKKNVVRLKPKKDGDVLLDALLYAVKFKGCSISREEIEEIKRLKD